MAPLRWRPMGARHANCSACPVGRSRVGLAVRQPDFLGWDGAIYTYVECDRAVTGIVNCFQNAARLCPTGCQIAE